MWDLCRLWSTMIFMMLGYAHRKKKFPSSSKSSKSRRFRMIQKFIYTCWSFQEGPRQALAETSEKKKLRPWDFNSAHLFSRTQICFFKSAQIGDKSLHSLQSLHLKPYLTLEMGNLLDHIISDSWILYDFIWCWFLDIQSIIIDIP